MKLFYPLLLMALMICAGFQAAAQVTNLTVNGVSANFTIVQGDSLKWEYNVPPGGTANGAIWIDLNGNGAIDPASDKLMFSAFTQTDGNANSNNGPGDMDGTVNGHIIYGGGNVGFAPAQYIFSFSNNGTGQTIVGTITPLPTPTYTISGVIIAPQGVNLQKILIGAQSENELGWWALTDASGHYTINFNAVAGGQQFKVAVVDNISPYTILPADTTITLNGNITGLNFTVGAPIAKVTGYLKGEDGHVFADKDVYTLPQNGNGGGDQQRSVRTDANGYYEFGYSQNDLNNSSIWQLIGESSLTPAYMVPQSGQISIHPHDSLRVDLTALLANATITGRITLDGHAPTNTPVMLWAITHASGWTTATSDPNTGNFTFHVSDKTSDYDFHIENNAIPSGYGFDNNVQTMHPGDNNIVVNLVRVAWLSQTSNTHTSLTSLSFVNPTTGWVAGNGGTVIHTTDGGTTWSQQNTNTNEEINGIFFIDALKGWFVGNNGIIKATTNGGTSWNAQNSTTNGQLNAVQFIDANIGYAACGGPGGAPRMLKTTDGGMNWFSLSLGTGDISSLSFIDAMTGWVTGFTGSTIFKTTDGGASWESEFIQGACGTSTVRFVDANNGWTGGNCGQIFRSTDGGGNWTLQQNGGCNILSISALNGTTAWAIGECQRIVGTTDGSTWTDQFSNPNGNFRATQFTDANTGWIVGDNGMILHTTTGGVVSAVKNSTGTLPAGFRLLQNYPNPFNPGTIIRYDLPQAGNVSLKVYNMLGQEVASIVEGFQTAGAKSVRFENAKLPSGIYFYRLSMNGQTQTKSMLLVK